MALAGALLALLVLSALVTTAFLTGALEQRAARGSADAVGALEAAEAGLAIVAGTWADLAPASIAVGNSAVLPSTSLDRWVAFTPTVWRLTDQLYLIRSEGVRRDASGNVLARREVVRLGRSDGVTLVPLPQRSWVHAY